MASVLFSSITLRGLTLPNWIVMSPRILHVFTRGMSGDIGRRFG